MDDNDLQELIAVYIHRKTRICWRECMDKILVMDEHNYDENLDEIYTVSVRGIIPTNVKIFQLPHSTCRIIRQHALCGKENLIVSEDK